MAAAARTDVRAPREAAGGPSGASSDDPPVIGVTLGDPRGIGPEVMWAAVRSVSASAGARFRVFGSAPLPLDTTGEVDTTRVGLWEGGSAREAGLRALNAIRAATEAARAGEIGALVTGPIDKTALHAAGARFPGHTELLRELTGVPDVGMLMVAEETRLGGPLRVLLATTHLALRDVPAALTADLLVERTTLLDRSLRRWWDVEAPRIALCALNPHASDSGLFGDEERTIMEPAVRRLNDAGVHAHGPIPADTVFSRAVRGEFDAVVAPYHDVGMATFKTVSFGRGVNVTLGLPFARTSPDHGTAFDIAGSGRADAGSATEAVRLAVRLQRTF